MTNLLVHTLASVSVHVRDVCACVFSTESDGCSYFDFKKRVMNMFLVSCRGYVSVGCLTVIHGNMPVVGHEFE